MKIKIIVLLFLGMMTGYAQAPKKPMTAKKPATTAAKKTAIKPTNANEGMFAIFETTKGKIEVKLEFQKVPVTVANFVSLVEGTNASVSEAFKGKRFYDGLKFHRVIKDFMIQGGDPQGNGSGGPGYAFMDEIVPEFKFDKSGILAMANSGPATNGSQFFITHKDTPWLTGKHTIFGYVTKGQDVVNAIAQDDVLLKVTIERSGAAAKKFDAANIFAAYMANKPLADKKLAEGKAAEMAAQEEARKKQAIIDAEKKQIYDKQYAPVKATKLKDLTLIRTRAIKSESGLESTIIKPGNGKPADGTTVFVHYAGYFEDGSLFDSSYEDISKAYGKFDEARASQGGYMPFPFPIGKKDGLIPGFLEGISTMAFGEKKVLFIPSNLAYGPNGYGGGIIPPNANLIFEVELFEKQPAPSTSAAPTSTKQ